MITKISLFKLVEHCVSAERMLAEGLIFTYPFTHLKSELEDILQRIPVRYELKNEHDTGLVLEINDSISIENFLDMSRLITLCGYYVSSVLMRSLTYPKGKRVNANIFRDKYLNTQWFGLITSINLTIEAKWDQEVFVEQNHVYHVTSKKHLSKIFKMGLVVKAKHIKANHPERVYVCLNINDAREFAIKRHPKDWAIIKIDISSMIDDVKFYQDPNYRKGLYTYDSFIPNLLSIAEEYKQNNDM